MPSSTTGGTEKQQWLKDWGPIIESGGGGDDGKVVAEAMMKCAPGAWNRRDDGRRRAWTAISWCQCRIVLLVFGSGQARTNSQFLGSNLM